MSARRIMLAGLLFAAALLGGEAVHPPARAAAQVPPTEEQAIAIEQQLLCPQCTNERLDVCPLAICEDMRRIIREQLEAGQSPEDILLFFEGRYGPKVRADLPREGFNLLLFGWVGLSLVLVGGVGGAFLLSMRRRRAPARTATPAAPLDEAWLDAQIDASETDDERGAR